MIAPSPFLEVFIIQSPLSPPHLGVAEPPKLYGTHVHVIVLMTSDYYTQEPDNSGSLSGVLRETQIIHNL